MMLTIGVMRILFGVIDRLQYMYTVLVASLVPLPQLFSGLVIF